MNISIILSGGVGSRMGLDTPKQSIDAIVIGRSDEWSGYICSQIDSFDTLKPIYFSQPGETRQYSIYNALLEARRHGIKQEDVVIIHDAARPLVSQELIVSCIEGCDEADGVLPIIPVKDSFLMILRSSIRVILSRPYKKCQAAPSAYSPL